MVMLAILGWVAFVNWAIGEDVTELFEAVVLVNTICLTLYIVIVTVPHYLNKMNDVNLRNCLKTLCLCVPLIAMFMLLSLHGELVNDPTQGRIMIAVYLLVVMVIISIIRLIYSLYKKKKAKEEIGEQEGIE